MLTVWSDGSYIKQQLSPADAGQLFDLGWGANGLLLTAESAPSCYRAGTLIRTDRGEVAVEALCVGDRIASAFGGTVAVTWLGHRQVDCRRHPKPQEVWPVRVAAGAFAAGQPRRDLWLSPDHAVFVDGVLIPIRYLINGATIVQEPVDAVTYWHVELPMHDVLFAEGMPAESYLDTGNRGAFENGGPVRHLHPDFALRVWEEDACAGLVVDGAELMAARSWLLARAEMLGHGFTTEPALRLGVEGRLLRPTTDGKTYRFGLPRGAERGRLISRSSVPAHVHGDSDDYRRLGVAVCGMALDGVAIALNDLPGDAGWHDIEGGSSTTWRWTNGDAGLVLTGGRDLEVGVLMTARYWAAAKGANAMAA
jgi:hypothetical protein